MVAGMGRRGAMARAARMCALVTAMHAGACRGATPQAAGAPPVARGAAAEAAMLESFLERSFDELGLVPGMAVAVVRDTGVVLLRGFGVTDVASRTPVTAHTPFYIASSTKSFVGTAAAILAERGVWSLDDPVSRWLPGVALPAPLSPDSVTLRHLLTHTSRIDNGPIVFRTAYSGEHDRATLLRLLAGSAVREPGFAYGNIGYVVASLAMDSAAGASWKDVLQREILDPLGMRHTSAYRSAVADAGLALSHGVGTGAQPFEVGPYIKVDANMHAAGGMITTAADLARWLEANLNEGRVDGRQLLPAAAVREAHRRQATTEARFHDFARTGYGLGWYHGDYDGDLVLHHFGNYPGFRAHVSFMPQHGIGVAVLTNESAQGYYVPEMVATAVYDRLLGKPAQAVRDDSARARLRAHAARVRTAIEGSRSERAQRGDSLALPPSAYVGRYVGQLGGTFIVRESPRGGLLASIGVLSSEMEPVDGGERLRVELIPGSGQYVTFHVQGARADSLRYDDMVFRRR